MYPRQAGQGVFVYLIDQGFNSEAIKHVSAKPVLRNKLE